MLFANVFLKYLKIILFDFSIYVNFFFKSLSSALFKFSFNKKNRYFNTVKLKVWQ